MIMGNSLINLNCMGHVMHIRFTYIKNVMKGHNQKLSIKDPMPIDGAKNRTYLLKGI